MAPPQLSRMIESFLGKIPGVTLPLCLSVNLTQAVRAGDYEDDLDICSGYLFGLYSYSSNLQQYLLTTGCLAKARNAIMRGCASRAVIGGGWDGFRVYWVDRDWLEA